MLCYTTSTSGGAAAVLTNRRRCAATAGWLLDLQPLRWWQWQLGQGADDWREQERIEPRCVVPHLYQRRTAAGLGAAGGLHHSNGQRVHWALSELMYIEAGRPSGDPLAAVSVSGAGAVPPQHSRDAWWWSLVSAWLTQSLVPLTLQHRHTSAMSYHISGDHLISHKTDTPL